MRLFLPQWAVLWLMRPRREPMTVAPCPNARTLPGVPRAPRRAPLANCCCHWRLKEPRAHHWALKTDLQLGELVANPLIRTL